LTIYKFFKFNFKHIQNCIPVLFSVEDEADVRAMLSFLLKSILNQKSALTAATLLKEYVENNEVYYYFLI
jgi:hypothetical protein